MANIADYEDYSGHKMTAEEAESLGILQPPTKTNYNGEGKR